MNHPLYAVQQIRRLRGGSRAQLLKASDGAYATKSAQNPQHVRVLANEMLATRLGHLLGLPVPRVESIEMSEWRIEHTSELTIDVGGSCMWSPPERVKRAAQLGQDRIAFAGRIPELVSKFACLRLSDLLK